MRADTLCGVVPWRQIAGAGAGVVGCDKIVLTFYCMPSAEWLTEFVSPGSEAMEKSYRVHRGGCRLAMRELSASLACRITRAACSASGRWGQLLGHHVLFSLVFYPVIFLFTLLLEMISLLPRILALEFYSSCSGNKDLKA